MFKKTYIYIKIHNDTELKYFGKTTKKNVKKYKGSGVYWKKHIKKHGYNCKTFIINVFENEEDCKNFCIWFSKINNIVKSKKWANLMYEDGINGIHNTFFFKTNEEMKNIKEKMRIKKIGIKLSEETRLKMSRSQKRIKRKKLSEETKQKISKALTGRKLNKKTIEKMRNSRIGKKHSKKAKLNMSLNNSRYWLGKNRNEETKQKISKNNSKYWLGKKMSLKAKENMRNAQLNLPKIKCPHCDKEGKIGPMKRWHFDNCKLKNISI